MEWKDIKGYEGYYQVSNKGQIKSLQREVFNGKGYFVREEQLLKPVNKYDTLFVQLQVAETSSSKQFKVKDIVASAFLKIPEEYPEEFYSVYFKDEENNFSPDNLYYDINENAVRLYDYEGNFLEDFPSTTEVEKATGINNSNMIPLLNGEKLALGAFQMRRLKYSKGIFKLPSLYKDRRGNTLPVAKYWNGKIVCTYNSILEAAEKNMMNPGSVAGSIEHNCKAKGFTFKKIQ